MYVFVLGQTYFFSHMINFFSLVYEGGCRRKASTPEICHYLLYFIVLCVISAILRIQHT